MHHTFDVRRPQHIVDDLIESQMSQSFWNSTAPLHDTFWFQSLLLLLKPLYFCFLLMIFLYQVCVDYKLENGYSECCLSTHDINKLKLGLLADATFSTPHMLEAKALASFTAGQLLNMCAGWRHQRGGMLMSFWQLYACHSNLKSEYISLVWGLYIGHASPVGQESVRLLWTNMHE